MKRDIIKIDEDLCDGCGLCIPNCHEGALQIIDNKARLISDLMCDGLGACIGHCPQGAISIEKREAEAYDEVKVMAEMILKGKNTVIAHLKHLKDHNEFELLKQGVNYLFENQDKLDFSAIEIANHVHNSSNTDHSCSSGGCPGSASISFSPNDLKIEQPASKQNSELRHWPVQMHLINPQANHFHKSDLVLAADCVAFSLGDFHQNYLNGKTLAIACPKLDNGLDIYTDKITSLINDAKINTLTVMMMEVPCCGGLIQIVKQALNNASRKVPVKAIIVGIKGEILEEEWIS